KKKKDSRRIPIEHRRLTDSTADEKSQIVRHVKKYRLDVLTGISRRHRTAHRIPIGQTSPFDLTDIYRPWVINEQHVAKRPNVHDSSDHDNMRFSIDPQRSILS